MLGYMEDIAAMKAVLKFVEMMYGVLFVTDRGTYMMQ
jgi:hypothetical protein